MSGAVRPSPARLFASGEPSAARLRADATIGCERRERAKRRKVSPAASDLAPPPTAEGPAHEPSIHRRRRRLPRHGDCPRRRGRGRIRADAVARRRHLLGAQRRDRAAGGRALHLRRLRLLPAGRPLAIEAQGRPERGRARLPRRLLGPARLEGPLRQRRLHRPPGRAAGEQRRALQLHAAGRGRRPGPQGLAGHRRAAGQSPGGAGRRAAGARRRPGHRDRRRHGRAHRSGSPPTGRSPSRATSPPSRPARTAA